MKQKILTTIIVCILLILADEGQAQEPTGEGFIVLSPPISALAADDPYFIGHIAVGVILPESEGMGENWTIEEMTNVYSQVQSAMDWWAEREPRANLTFTYEWHWRVPTIYEPITMPILGDHLLWISDVMDNLGYESEDALTAVAAYNEDLKTRHGADWGVTIFVVDSSNDLDGAWPDGFMFAYECELFMGVTYDADGYGIQRLDMAVAPGIGAAFCALPQFAAAQIPCTQESGCLKVETQNSEYGICFLDEPSIMRYAWQAWGPPLVDHYARGQLGWWDRDCDDILDPVDEWVDPSGCHPWVLYFPIILK